MKTYQSEQMFVENFAKDSKESLKNGQNFEAEINGVNVVVTAMDNNNSSKVTIYQGSVNGVAFSGSNTALKKKLNITYTKEYNRNSEASTKVTIKSDDELAATAKVAAKRIGDAFEILYKASQRYGLSRAEMLERTETVESLILEALKQQRDKVQQAKEAEEKRRAEEAKKKAEESAKREATKRQLLEALAAASANGNMAEIMRLSKALKNYM